MKLLRISNVIVLLLISNASANHIVSQTNIFSGEVASNLTSGAPLSVSAAGKITTGITNFSPNLSSGAITTTSTASPPTAVMTGLTETPAAGTYGVTFSGWFTNTTGNQTTTICIAIAGTCQTASEITFVPFSGAVGGVNDGTAASTGDFVTVNGSQAIAMVWNAAGGTATAKAGVMMIWRVQ